MSIFLKPLKDLKDNYHKADYKSGGNYQTSYYRFLEEGGTRAPEVYLRSEDLSCEYILSSTIIPFELDVRTHNKLVGNISVTTSVGETSHRSEQLANEAYSFTFYANAMDVAENRYITVTFEGLNKFEEEVIYTVNVPYSVEEDCYSMGCESNSNKVAFVCDASGVYTLSVNGRRYSSRSLSDLDSIAEENNLSIKFYRREAS